MALIYRHPLSKRYVIPIYIYIYNLQDPRKDDLQNDVSSSVSFVFVFGFFFFSIFFTTYFKCETNCSVYKLFTKPSVPTNLFCGI